MSKYLPIIIPTVFALGFVLAWVIQLVRAKAVAARQELALARLGDAEAALARERDERKSEIDNLGMAFKGISSEVLKDARDEFLKQAEPRLSEHVKPLSDALKRYEEALNRVEGDRRDAYGGMRDLIKSLQEGHTELARETTTLSQALKNPVARGQWGEMTLKRVVEMAGMSEYCDFTEQETVDGASGKLRPDMVVNLPGGRTVIVDSKSPNSAFMDAIEAVDETARQTALSAHVQAVRDHMRLLGQKAYWQQFEQSPDFVIMFLPGESFFSAALEQDRDLIEAGMKNRVVLATPTTLIVLLRSVAMGWQQQQGAENAKKIVDAGKELFDRCSVFAKKMVKVGSSLGGAIKSFNESVGSWESRVMPSARRLKELGATSNPDEKLPDIAQVETLPRSFSPSDESAEFPEKKIAVK